MIRAMDSNGALIIGIPRRVLERMLSHGGAAISEPQAPEDCQLVVMLFAGDTDEHIVENMRAHYGGRVQEVIDNRSKP